MFFKLNIRNYTVRRYNIICLTHNIIYKFLPEVTVYIKNTNKIQTYYVPDIDKIKL